MVESKWWMLNQEAILRYWQTDKEKGLTAKEASLRLKEYGENKIVEQKPPVPWQILLSQFNDFMIFILLSAALISGFLGEWIDTVAILLIVVLNGFLGFIQEYKAERSLQALKQLTAPTAKVIRDSQIVTIPAKLVVNGDILQLDTGDRVAADARLIEAYNLKVEEAVLTGESVPVEKDITIGLQDNPSLGEKRNMVFTSTKIVYGRGKAVVVACGMSSELGKIANLLQKVEHETTPLQHRLEKVGRGLVYVCLAICGVVFALGIARGGQKSLMFLTAVSLAVAAIPEGLPAIVTIVLALGVQRMAKRNALIRKLPAVETLGCTTVICSDKTGTLTQNQMMVRKIYTGDELIELTGSGYTPVGEFILNNKPIKVKKNNNLLLALRIGVLCNNAQLGKDEKTGMWQVIGDPTEGALLVAGAKADIWRKNIEEDFEYIDEIPFDSTKKRMTAIFKKKSKIYIFTKGAPNVILDLATFIYNEGKIESLTLEKKNAIDKINNELAHQALRLLAVAYKEISVEDYQARNFIPEKDLVWMGLVGMMDLPRQEVKPALQKCRQAGIKVVMITGDQRETAIAVAKELEALDAEGIVITGKDLDQKSVQELSNVVDQIQVYAQTSAEHKLKIIQALKEKGHIIAMTGDGVNDAPAVKEADIGIAMGITGTDVTKEASDMVLGDDNFVSIVSAIEEGRSIYANIKRFVYYLLSCNTGEILVMLAATLIGLPLPLMPIQILWINLVTDGLPALALGVEPVEKQVMDYPPRNPKESILSNRDIVSLMQDGFLIGLGALLAFVCGLYWLKLPLAESRGMAFFTLAFAQLTHAFNCRNFQQSIFKIGFFSNFYLVGAIIISILLQTMTLSVPFFRPIFKTVYLDGRSWLVIIILSCLPLLVKELIKKYSIKQKLNIIR